MMEMPHYPPAEPPSFKKEKMRKVFCLLLLPAGIITVRYVNADNAQSIGRTQICKAAISTIMGQSPSIIKIDKEDSGIIFVSYIRPSDKSMWEYRCRIDGTRVIWASKTGRWRDHALDEVITYSGTQNSVTIAQKFTDGSSTSKIFSKADLSSR
ncbi:hypothetical protein [Herbaspirillum frisingense]|uniref:hypothetical protein n=1 Tax=Herbaspirillum frisingense TaxID=92645 RepID=UPI001F3ADDFC|nr:hypothetical protein [Herbaspirillum frisingense]UIN23501.1 hypothetical protein LAZ82_10565 [Herbaspirillum frisingense]